MPDPVIAPTITPVTPAPASPSPAVVPIVASPQSPSSDSFVTVPAAPVAPAVPVVAPVVAPAALTRPEGIPDDLWDATTGVKFADVATRLKEASDAKVAADAAKGALPKTAEEYAPTLPAALKLPEGTTINVNDPRFKAAQKLAFESGMSQEKFTELLGIEAAGAVEKNAAVQRAITARNTALGPNATARVDALTVFFNATAETPQIAKELAQTLWTPGIVAHYEKLQVALGSQGVAALTRVKAADGDAAGKIPGYDKMTFAEKMVVYENKKAAGGGR